MVLYYQSYITVILKSYYTTNILGIKPKSASRDINTLISFSVIFRSFRIGKKANFWWGKNLLFCESALGIEKARRLAVTGFTVELRRDSGRALVLTLGEDAHGRRPGAGGLRPCAESHGPGRLFYPEWGRGVK